MIKWVLVFFTIVVSFSATMSFGAAQVMEINRFQSTLDEAKLGAVDAQFDLAQMYDTGNGVSQDYTQALKWYSRAAKQGHAISQYNLGSMYNGGKGVSVNIDMAYV